MNLHRPPSNSMPVSAIGLLVSLAQTWVHPSQSGLKRVLSRESVLFTGGLVAAPAIEQPAERVPVSPRSSKSKEKQRGQARDPNAPSVTVLRLPSRNAELCWLNAKCAILSLLAGVSLAAQTRRYSFTITNKWDVGDGHGRPVFAINNETPGPLIEAEEGDEVEVFLDNQLAFETTMHWHGIYQIDRPRNDGVLGVTQHSIQPRDTYTYRFTLISSSPVDIEGMKRAEKHPKHVVISDWNAEPMDILLIMYWDTGIVPWCSNSIVLNGKGRTVCNPRELIDAVGGPGRNSLGSHHELQISVDEHEFYVIAADREFVRPQKVHAANYLRSILIRLDQKPGDYAIRLTSLRPEQVIQGFEILRYPDQGSEVKQEVPNTKSWVHLNGTLISSSSVAMGETKLAPYPARPPPPKADNTVRFFVNMTGPSSWALNIGPHQAFRQQLPPLLWDEESRGETTYGDNTQGGALQNGTVVDVIFENGANVTSQHPFHKHNNKAFVIGTGTGGFPWPTVEDAIREGGMAKHFNLVNPPNRDGCRLGNRTGDWSVIRYEIAFPAASMLHCHMIHHFAAGQQVMLLEGVESMAQIPAEMKDRVHSDFPPPLLYGPLD
ncbi:laccase TilA [Colletotrichum phormii]|uniref:Laccase TilA n=1 Tax=Colletotrichum phormii TaxID=359342 RepID=A0AAI9ZIU6_9PEZI|nr:laccase TilA [Colletotrichum phormii]KAK1624186.1 laccase TilA [Colletotrichum phormii]